MTWADDVQTGPALPADAHDLEERIAIMCEADDSKPEIEITTEEFEVTTQAIDALARDSADLFSRGGRLVTIQTEERKLRGVNAPKGTPQIVDLPRPSLQERMSKSARWVRRIKVREEFRTVDAHPPSWCVAQVEARGRWPGVRALEAITEVPVLRPDGTVLSRPGYDEKTGLLYIPSGVVPSVKHNPTLDDAREAASRLLDLVCDFPFEKPEHKSAWFASLLTVFARFSFHGPVPLFLADANVRGSGKSTLVDLVSLLYTGREAPRMTATSNEEESRKRITSLVLAGSHIVLIDNVAGKLGDQHIDALLTGTEWTDRVLGESRQITLPQRTTWFASGNNVQLAADTSRRTCHIRLNHPDERPELRTGFKYPNLMQYVRTNRAKLVADAVTVLRAFECAGRPSANMAPWGSFEAWSEAVRSIVVWVGLPDPGLTREHLIESSDTEATALGELLDAWHNIDCTQRGFTVSAMLRTIFETPERTDCQRIREALEELTSTPAGGSFKPKQVGQTLKRFVGRVVDGKMLQVKRERTNQGVIWAIVSKK